MYSLGCGKTYLRFCESFFTVLQYPAHLYVNKVLPCQSVITADNVIFILQLWGCLKHKSAVPKGYSMDEQIKTDDLALGVFFFPLGSCDERAVYVRAVRDSSNCRGEVLNLS